MSDPTPAAALGDIKSIFVDPFDGGLRCLLVFNVKKKLDINGLTTDNVGAILEEKQIEQLVDQLLKIAVARERAMARNIITV